MNRRQTATISRGGMLPEGSTLLPRSAKPLNGIEVADAIRAHLLDLATTLVQREALKEPAQLKLTEQLIEDIGKTFSRQYRLQKIHIAYPKVGWAVRVRLERLDDAGFEHALHAECDLDLERNVRILLQFGESGKGPVVDSIEDERLSSSKPDEVREQFGMPVEAEFMKPNGDIGKVDIRELKGPKRAARSVDVGSGAADRIPVQLTDSVVEDGQVVVKDVEVMVAGGEQGQEIELPSIPLEELLAEPPQIEKAPSPLPPPAPGGMGKTSRPNVKFNRR